MANQNVLEFDRNKKIDVLIVGAGLSGLISALKIMWKEPSLRVRILEESNIVGGQLTKVSLGEVGAKWISKDQYHIYRLLKNLDITMHKRNILSSHLKAHRDLDEGVFSVLANYELKRYINELELKSKLYKPVLIKYNGQSMHHHIQNRLFFSSARKYMMNLVILICGVEAKEISLRDFMAICYTCGGLKRLVDLVIESPNHELLEFSSNELFCKILHNIKNTDIICRRKVTEIKQRRDFVEVRDSENEYHIAEALILAVPLNRSQNIRFWPPLPNELQTLMSQSSDKYIITSFLIRYAQGYWRLKGFSGYFIKHEPIIIACEYRPTTYAGFMIHVEGIEPLVKSIVIHELSKTFGKEMLLPLEFQQCSYQLNNLAHPPLTTPWNRVIWSSSAAAATCYRGRLGGAVQSGIRAAMNALLICRPQIVTCHDMVELQCRNYQRKEPTWTTLFLSTCNLYNVSSYILFICGVVLVLTKTYKKL